MVKKKKQKQLLKSEGRNEYTDTGSSMNFKCDESKETQTEIDYNQTAKSQRQRASWTARKGITKSTSNILGKNPTIVDSLERSKLSNL